MDNLEDVIFEAKPPSFLVDLKRILIVAISLNLIFAIFYKWSWTRAISVAVVFAFMDMITFYLPAISRRYIVTDRYLIIKRKSSVKEIPFSELGSISAAKGKILLVSDKGKILAKINELFIAPSDREKFKDHLFERMKKSSKEEIRHSDYTLKG